VGGSIGPFVRVVASDAPRTVETSLAMGIAVDDILSFPTDIEWDAVIAEVGWHSLWDVEKPFAHIARCLTTWPNARRMGEHYAAGWLRIAESVGEGESALVISHGQLMEIALVCCLPGADHESWGGPFKHCEGVQLAVEDGRFTDAHLLRVEAQ
jgi:broad specificity phosphatase PhoE